MCLKYNAKPDCIFVFAVGGQGVFREFLKSEFSEENMEFWLACEEYKKTKSDHLHGKAERIYEEFVQSNAVKQVSTKLMCTYLYLKYYGIAMKKNKHVILKQISI